MFRFQVLSIQTFTDYGSSYHDQSSVQKPVGNEDNDACHTDRGVVQFLQYFVQVPLKIKTK